MGQQDPLSETRRFGKFLRKVRESRKLSLDAVEEMSVDFPDRLTKSHLSRIENGQAEPNFRKLFALSQIYKVPLTSMAEEFEIDLKRSMVEIDLTGKSGAEIARQARSLIESGRHDEALYLLTAALENFSTIEKSGDAEEKDWSALDLRLVIINCLGHLGRHERAKLETEELLNNPALTAEQRLRALHFFVVSCYRLSRFTIALMGLERAEKEFATGVDIPSEREADFAVLRGNVEAMAGRPGEASASYGRALRIYESVPNPFEVCRTRINMANALTGTGDHKAARGQLEAALLVAEASGYDRQTCFAMSHLAVLAYKEGDLKAAQTWAIRSNTIARSREYISQVFRNCYYLWKIAQASGDHSSMKVNERTLRAYVGRIEEYLPEAEAFRASMTRGES